LAQATECPKNTPFFGDYPVDSIYRGPPGPVDTVAALQVGLWGASEGTARQVDATLAGGPNFAGRYTIVDTHCGSPCEKQTIVDTKTGHLLRTFETALGADFRLASRLIVANPVDSSGCYDPNCAYCRPIYFVWTGTSLDSIW